MKNSDYKVDPKAAIEGRQYQEDKPWSCKFCYWWEGPKKGCGLEACHYLLPEQEAEALEEYGPGHCKGCPYGRHRRCIGYCIAKIQKEMKERRENGRADSC